MLMAKIQTIPRQQLGILCAVLAVFTFASQDAFTKVLSAHYSVSQFLSVRFAAFLIFALMFVHARCGIKTALRSKIPLLQLFRAGLIAAEIGVFAYVVGSMDLSAQHAVFSCFPLMATALSVPILGERVGVRRWTAVLVGLVGVLIILRPGFGIIHPLAPLVLLGAFLFGLYNVMSRYVTQRERFETAFIYMALVCFGMYAIPAFFVWQPMTRDHILIMTLLCFTSVTGHWLYTKAFEYAEASVLQPYNYLLLVFATLYGVTIFGEVFEPLTALGSSIVVGAGLYVWWRERAKAVQKRRRAQRQDQSQPPTPGPQPRL